MIESLEDKLFTLDVAGEDLIFLLGTIKAIPNENVNEYRLETDSEVYSSKEYYFQTIQDNIDLLNISELDTFDFLVDYKTFKFQVKKISSDINGWKKLTCVLLEIS